MELFQKLQSYSEDELIELFKDKNKYEKLFTDINFSFNSNSLSFKFENFNYIIFLESIKIIIKDKKNQLITNVRTNVAIKDFLKQYDFDINKIVIINKSKEQKFDKCFNFIDIFINKDNILELKKIYIEIPDFIFNEQTIPFNENLNPFKYSTFFYDYFPTIKKYKENEVFDFKINSKRKNMLININLLMNEEIIKKYKITGPLSTGKSMTLFKISLAYKNIIYINLKILKKNNNNLYKCLQIIFSACSRIFFKESEKKDFKQKLEKIDLTHNIFKILLEILHLIMSTKNDYIYLILDQFKSDNIDNYKEFTNSIEEMIKQKLKVIYCSSINDKEMRDELIKSFIKYQGELEALSEDNQNYYFYYSDLYTPKRSKKLTYKLFKNKYSYSKLFDENNLSDSLNKINKKIISKLKIFKVHSQEKEITNYNYSLSDILLLLKKIIYKKQEMCSFINIISICPFKYFIIDINLKDKTFIIMPAFPYMVYFINDYVKYKDCDNYFLKEKYNINSFLSNKVKGEYFEYSAKIGIKEKLKLPEEINEEIFVDQIAEMNRIANDFEEFLLEIEEMEKIIEKENEEEEDEEDKNEEEDEEEDDEGEEVDDKSEEEKENEDKEEYKKIKQYLDGEINEEEIYNKIRNYYEKEYENMDILKKNKDYEKQNEIKKQAELLGIEINERENNEIKDISDYRKEQFEKYIQKRKKEIVNILKKRKTKNKFKRIALIPIEKQTKNKENIKNRKFTGNENFFIDQKNTNGKILDYGILFGNKNNKTFVSFQMKCYSNQTYLNELVVDKAFIKSKISPMLLNSIKLFNINITQWHYFLVLYYNNKDLVTNNIEIRSILLSLNKDIQLLFYNPVEKKFFYLNDGGFNFVKKLDLNDKSNLDYCFYLNARKNYCLFEQEFNKINKREEIISRYWDGLSNFIKDLRIYNEKNILQYLSKVFKVKKLYYCLNFYDTIINKPNDKKIFLYKKKNSNHFIGIKNNNNKITYYDLQNEEEITNCSDLIDLNYKYVYILDYNNLKRDDSFFFEDLKIGIFTEENKKEKI